MFNLTVFSYNIYRIVPDTITCSIDSDENNDETTSDYLVSITDFLVPISLSLILSLMHSQIVATASNAVGASKQHKRLTDIMKPNRKKCERRLRRKSSRTRSSLNFPVDNNKSLPFILPKSCLTTNHPIKQMEDTSLTDYSITSTSIDQSPTPIVKKLVRTDSNNEETLRKRNVNWDSPIKRNVVLESRQNDQESEPDAEDDVRNSVAPSVSRPFGNHHGGDDDGFESLNGKSSSGEEMTSNKQGTNEIEDQPDNENTSNSNQNIGLRASRSLPAKIRSKVDTSDTDEDNDDLEIKSSSTLTSPMNGGSSATEWIGITTNSEDCSYSSADNSDSQMENSENGYGEFDNFTPTVILNSGCGLSDRSKWMLRCHFENLSIS